MYKPYLIKIGIYTVLTGHTYGLYTAYLFLNHRLSDWYASFNPPPSGTKKSADLPVKEQVILRETNNLVINARPSPNVEQDVHVIQDQVAFAGDMVANNLPLRFY